MYFDNFISKTKCLYKAILSIITLIMIFLIKSYQYCISPYIISSCRYHVNCSNFMIRSIKNKGIIKGLLFGIVRIIKCNPFINHN